MEYQMGFCFEADDIPEPFQNPAWHAQTDTAVSLWVSQAKCQFLSLELELAILQRLPRVM